MNIPISRTLKDPSQVHEGRPQVISLQQQCEIPHHETREVRSKVEIHRELEAFLPFILTAKEAPSKELENH